MTEPLPVIDLDDTVENRNWLRIVGVMRQHDAGQLTDAEYEQQLKVLRGEIPLPEYNQLTPPHDPAIHGNDGLSNPIDEFRKAWSPPVDMHTTVHRATPAELHDIIGKLKAQPDASHPTVKPHLDKAEVELGHAALASRKHRHQHLQRAKEHVTRGLGAMSTVNALLNNRPTPDADDKPGAQDNEPDADDTGGGAPASP